jgi:dihydroorotase
VNRREFAFALAGGAITLGQNQSYDLVVRGGRVIDPSQGLSAIRDIGIAGNTIARISPDIPRASARTVLDARDRIVTPGLVDIHVHVYDGVALVGIPADSNAVAKGVTTVVDAGSAGATTFPGFRKYVVERSTTRIYALLNISTIGLVSGNEFADLAHVNPQSAARVIAENRDVIVGIKARMTATVTADQNREVLRRARQACDMAGVPLMVHVDGSALPLKDVFALLQKGDVVTHVLRGEGGILDAAGRVLPEALEASRQGVIMDVGHGAGTFSFDAAERALGQGWLPDTISSDLHSRSVNGPAFDFATTLSKFLLLGLTLEQVVERATTNPARAFRFPSRPGNLQEGSEADVAILKVAEGTFEFIDSGGNKRTGETRLEPVATIRAGRLYKA